MAIRSCLWLLPVVMLACAGEGDSLAIPVERSDSAGVPVFTLSRVPAWDDASYLWTLSLERAVPTGASTPDARPLIYQPQGYARMPDGSFVVLDGWERRLVVLGAEENRAEARFAPSGQGPGEIRSANAVLWPADDGSFWVLDPGNLRLSRFTTAGILEEERSVAMAGMGGLTVQRVGSNEPFSWRVFFEDAEAGLLTDSVGRFDIATGRVQYIAPMPPRPETRSRNSSPAVLFDPMGWFAPVGSGVVVGRSDRGRFWHYSDAGELVAIFEAPMEQRPIAEAERTEILEEFLGVVRGSVQGTVPLIAESYPLFNTMWQVGDSLYAIQQTHRSTPGDEPAIPVGQTVWRVFSLQGEYAGAIVFPSGFGFPYWVEEGRITGTRRDELGVATIETYRVSPPAWRE